MVAMLMVGCTNDLDEGVFAPSEDALSIKIEGRISQTYTTRVNDGGFCDGDQIGLFGVNYTSNNLVAGSLLDKGNQVDNARYTFDEANWTWKSQGGVYYKDAETNIDLYGYYPYGSVESVNAYKFEVAQDQSGANDVDGYAMSDFLWGKATNVAPSEEKVKIRFDHKMACANVILAEGDGFAEGEFAMLKKSVLAMNAIRTAEIDLSTGKATAVGEAESEGIVMKSNAEGFRAIVVPQNIETGKTLFTITIDGISYRFKKDADFTYEAGKQSKFTITINKKEHSGEYEFVLTDTEIVDWIADLDSNGGEARQYYVVHLDEPGTLSAKIKADGKDPAKIKNLKVSGKISGGDFALMGNSMNILQAVNLKECKIVDCKWYSYTDIDGEYRFETFDTDFPSSRDECYQALKARYPNSDIEFSEYYKNNNYGEGNDVFPNNLARKSTLTTVVFPEKVTKIVEGAFSYCSQLSGALIIPDDVKEIEQYAFRECSNLSSLSLPYGLESIGDNAFRNCSSLSGTLELPSSIKRIGGSAFVGCSGFTGQLVLPEGLTWLGDEAFYQCSGFTGDLIIPESLTSIGRFTFCRCNGLNGQLIMHDELKELGQNVFDRCSFQGELKLPANLTQIPDYCFSQCEFSSIVEFPEGLLSIGKEAFNSNTRLMGVLEFPESLISLGEKAFEYCIKLEGIVLPPDLGAIKSDAFNSCFGLNKIVCRSTEPPVVLSGAFAGVAKDNFAVEVPESAVNRYQSASGWNEFKRIVAHHDFTISRRLMRTLNAEHSRKLVLRAPSDQAWSVESCPEWVTVTPSSGVGKAEVVVTVNEMTDAEIGTFEIDLGTYNNHNFEMNNGRAGEVVFLLNNKDYRTSLKVEQYDYEYGDGDVIVNQSATVGGGVNIVFMGDCFDARDIARGSYLAGINEAIGYYFDIEPYKTYRNYFNVYTIFGMSEDSGVGTVNTIRDSKFGSMYTLNAGVSPNASIAFEYAMKAENVTEGNLNETLVVLIENTTDYGGCCYMWEDGSAIACCPMSDDAYPYDFRGVVQHDAGGHGFGKLADESILHNAFIQSCGCLCHPHLDSFYRGKSLGWYRNLEAMGGMDEVTWSHLIFHPKYSNIVDIYEGGYNHSRGIFRSEPVSCMNNYIPYYSAISRQEIVERIKRYAGEEFSLEEFYANDVLDIQGNNTSGTRSIEKSAITLIGAGKQMPPKFMGDKPQLKKSNK